MKNSFFYILYGACIVMLGISFIKLITAQSNFHYLIMLLFYLIILTITLRMEENDHV